MSSLWSYQDEAFCIVILPFGATFVAVIILWIESFKALSKKFGVSESALRDLLVTADVEFRKHPITPTEIELAVQLYECGLTVKQIVKRLYYPIGTIRRLLREIET